MDNNEGEKEEKIKKKKKGNGKIKRFFYKIITIVVIVAIGIGAFYFGVKNSYRFEHKAYSLNIGLKDVGELVTQTAYVRVIEDSSTDRKIFETIKVPFTESRKIFSMIIQVDASVQFDEIKIRNIDDELQKIYVQIPHAKLYNATPNRDSFVSHLDAESLFSRINSNMQNELEKDMIEKAKEEAVANGILENADEYARKLIESFIKGNIYYSDYSVEFEYIEGE